MSPTGGWTCCSSHLATAAKGSKRLLRYAINELNAEYLDVNEQNPKALGFYLHEGFEVIGRSETDGLGQPYPLLHMRLMRTVP